MTAVRSQAVQVPEASRSARPAGRDDDNAVAEEDRGFMDAMEHLSVANPFAPERALAERAALGSDFAGDGAPSENGRRLAARLRRVVERARGRFVAGATASERDRVLYQTACLHHCDEAIAPRLSDIVVGRAPKGRLALLFRELAAEHERLLGFPGSPLRPPSPERVFAFAYQRRRAHHHLTSSIIGSARPVAELRAGVWCSIFTHDRRAYESGLYDRLDDVSTLITGPTGTGKELVARTIGLSRYVPFDATGHIAVPDEDGYHPVNLAAMSSSLIESELFGHARGAFTGATEERPGCFDCGPGETLLLDEIGEIDMPLQVKLLRVLQTRRFLPVGSRKERPFSARLVCATHRDLPARVEEGTFRRDLRSSLVPPSDRSPWYRRHPSPDAQGRVRGYSPSSQRTRCPTSAMV